MTTKATVWILETLNFSDETERKEGEILSRTLRLSRKHTAYTYIRTRQEFEAFVREFGNSAHRYLHISCHGETGAFHTTTEGIPAEEFADILAPHVDERRVFLSTCLAANDSFAKALLLNSGCLSVVGPAGSIDFDDAAIFWAAFYHLMFKDNPDSMNRQSIEKNLLLCAKLVGERFRFFYKQNGRVVQKLIPEGLPKKANK
jgi:hypothetical protein